MRSAKKKTTMKVGTDLLEQKTLDLLIAQSDADDCFGKEWKPSATECSLCADKVLCAILTQKQTNELVKKRFKDEKFLDDSSFQNLKIHPIINAMIKAYDEGEPYGFNDLIDAIKTLSKSDDDKAIENYCKKIVVQFNLTDKLA